MYNKLSFSANSVSITRTDLEEVNFNEFQRDIMRKKETNSLDFSISVVIPTFLS